MSFFLKLHLLEIHPKMSVLGSNEMTAETDREKVNLLSNLKPIIKIKGVLSQLSISFLDTGPY